MTHPPPLIDPFVHKSSTSFEEMLESSHPAKNEVAPLPTNRVLDREMEIELYKVSQARKSVSAYVNAAVRTLDWVKNRSHKTINTTETIKEAVADSGIRENADGISGDMLL